jgi:hypothetical protein
MTEGFVYLGPRLAGLALIAGAFVLGRCAGACASALPEAAAPWLPAGASGEGWPSWLGLGLLLVLQAALLELVAAAEVAARAKDEGSP